MTFEQLLEHILHEMNPLGFRQTSPALKSPFQGLHRAPKATSRPDPQAIMAKFQKPPFNVHPSDMQDLIHDPHDSEAFDRLAGVRGKQIACAVRDALQGKSA